MTADLEFVGWLCPCHRRVVRPEPDGTKPTFHLISKDEGTLKCNVNPDLWLETFVRPLETSRPSRPLIVCPGCPLELADDDLMGQRDHMTAHHPEIITQRLEEAGFRRGHDGRWIDCWASD